MKSTDLRAKARAIFGPAIAEPMPKQPNGAKALQERANARPIPTYKDGGAIKKPVLTAAERKMGDALMMTKKGRDVMAYQDRMAAEKAKSDAEKRARADKMLGITAKKDGGKVRTSADTARALATEMGGMKKGGACMGKPVKKAVGGAGKTRKGQAPIKRAQGGAAKVRKGMMTPTGQITPGKRCK